MLYSFPVSAQVFASFILPQPREGQEHNTHFRLTEAVAFDAVK